MSNSILELVDSFLEGKALSKEQKEKMATKHSWVYTCPFYVEEPPIVTEDAEFEIVNPKQISNGQ